MSNATTGSNLDQLNVAGRDESLATLEILVLALVFLLATGGNSFILYALLKQRKVRPWSRIYHLMAQLSIADLLVALLNILPQLAWDITFRFHGGDTLCKAVKYGQVFVLYLSTNVLLVMSFDRYLAVNRPGQWNSSRLTRRLVSAAWALSAALAIPQLFIFSYREVEPNVHDCWADFGESDWAQKFYVVWFTGSIFILPLVAIAICYGAICFQIWRYRPSNCSNARYGGQAVVLEFDVTPSSPSKLARTLSVAKLKTVKLTLIVVICFIICWFPFCSTQLYLAFWPPTNPTDVGPLHTILLLLASLNSCCNPWIYLAFSESLTGHLKKCLGAGQGSSCGSDLYDSVGDEEDDDHGDGGCQRNVRNTHGRSPIPGSPPPAPRITATTATM